MRVWREKEDTGMRRELRTSDDCGGGHFNMQTSCWLMVVLALSKGT